MTVILVCLVSEWEPDITWNWNGWNTNVSIFCTFLVNMVKVDKFFSVTMNMHGLFLVLHVYLMCSTQIPNNIRWHIGVLPDQYPAAWHMRVLFPNRKYSALQLYMALLPNVVPAVWETMPLLGLVRVPQSTAVEGNIIKCLIGAICETSSLGMLPQHSCVC